MRPNRARSIAADAIVATSITAILWGAVFPGLAVWGMDVAFVVFPFVALTVGMWGWWLYRLAMGGAQRPPQTARATTSARAARTFAALDQLQSGLKRSSDLPEPLVRDVRRAVAELRSEATLEAEVVAICDRELQTLGHHDGLTARRRAAAHRLTEIGSAADDFLGLLQSAPTGGAGEDSVERLQAARRAMASVAREVNGPPTAR